MLPASELSQHRVAKNQRFSNNAARLEEKLDVRNAEVTVTQQLVNVRRRRMSDLSSSLRPGSRALALAAILVTLPDPAKFQPELQQPPGAAEFRVNDLASPS